MFELKPLNAPKKYPDKEYNNPPSEKAPSGEKRPTLRIFLYLAQSCPPPCGPHQ